MHPAEKPEEELVKELQFEATRSRGPGGQHRNRVATAIRVTHIPTGITAMATEKRSQLENKVEALFRIRVKLAMEVRSELVDGDFVPPAAYKPSELWMGRLKGAKMKVNPHHSDFPALLAEVLDRLHLEEDDLDRTATALRISKSQLIKFLAIDPAALHALNERRKSKGQHPLRS
ncbi:MAG: peptide chain release factor family protein [Planctomycetota bacterium]